eukprot:TRINITY_DN4196_c0_g1_i2.p1 TRINITY_DN4196_c0_g1~~TRINITY_DN4196_c0_g1_i2.p1  ORF type:complete len:200 (-),score=22.14 TRINITY_DN4196_c0_g1_i2:72-671(-)
MDRFLPSSCLLCRDSLPSRPETAAAAAADRVFTRASLPPPLPNEIFRRGRAGVSRLKRERGPPNISKLNRIQGGYSRLPHFRCHCDSSGDSRYGPEAAEDTQRRSAQAETVRRIQGQPSVDVWQTKPAWCQPWTILLTGSSAVVGSWELLHISWLTVIITVGVGAWWFVFLVLYPKAYEEMVMSTTTQMTTSSDNDSQL